MIITFSGILQIGECMQNIDGASYGGHVEK